jgi:glycosyltransferase involved in cell wall biosynthesis
MVRVGVVVPTRNSERTLRACLASLRAQTIRPRVIVVDNHSTDATHQIADGLADLVVVAGPERSGQRNLGARLLTDADVVGFVDSDMVVERTVVEEVRAAVSAGADALVVPEHTVGRGFVARVRAFERAQYVGASRVEAARFFRRPLLIDLGGFDEELDAGEDWDLDLRARASGAAVRAIEARIWHDESEQGFVAHCAKKGRYAVGLRRFLDKHGDAGRAVLFDRPYLRQPWRLLRHPVLGTGLVLLKSGETAAVAWRLASRPARGAGH